MSSFKRFYNVVIQRLQTENEHILSYTADPTLPIQLDLSKNMDLIYQQGSIGSCTAQALAWALRYKNRNFQASRLFLYYYSRLFDYREGDNTPMIDDGTTLIQGVNVLRQKGICPENKYPYRTWLYWMKPPASLNKIASRNRVLRYGIVQQNIDSMKAVLNQGMPFVFGFLVYSSFENRSVDQTGIIPMPNTSTERILGGHAVVAVGYDDDKRLIKFANSWGREWGENGYGYIPYDYVLNPRLTDDFWVIYDVLFSGNNRRKRPSPHRKIRKRTPKMSELNYRIYLHRKNLKK